MTKAFRNIVATLALLTMMAAAGNLAWAQSTAKQRSAAPAPAFERTQLQTTADRASAKIQSSETDKKALFACVQSKNTEQARSLLLKNGFSAKQLEGAKFEFHNNTGNQGYSQKIKVKVSVECCPVKVVITLTF